MIYFLPVNEMEKNLYISALLDIYGRFLSEKQRSLCEHYYNDDLSLSEIAENEGITRQGVCDSIKRTETKLTAWEKECGYCEKIARLKALAAKPQSDHEKTLQAITEIIENF